MRNRLSSSPVSGRSAIANESWKKGSVRGDARATEIVARRVQFFGPPPAGRLGNGAAGGPSLEIDQEAPVRKPFRA